jgi:hypothetical protein
MPEASKSNSHGYIHGTCTHTTNNTSGVVNKLVIPTPDVTGVIGLESLRLYYSPDSFLYTLKISSLIIFPLYIADPKQLSMYP